MAKRRRYDPKPFKLALDVDELITLRYHMAESLERQQQKHGFFTRMGTKRVNKRGSAEERAGYKTEAREAARSVKRIRHVLDMLNSVESVNPLFPDKE